MIVRALVGQQDVTAFDMIDLKAVGLTYTLKNIWLVFDRGAAPEMMYLISPPSSCLMRLKTNISNTPRPEICFAIINTFV